MRTWEFMGATLVYAEPGEVAAAIGPRTKAVSVSHITSPTALVTSGRGDLRRRARGRACSRSSTARTHPDSFRSISRRLGADIYAGTATSGSARRREPGFSGRGRSTSAWIEPLVISWGYGAGGELRRSGTAGRERAIRRRS